MSTKTTKTDAAPQSPPPRRTDRRTLAKRNADMLTVALEIAHVMTARLTSYLKKHTCPRKARRTRPARRTMCPCGRGINPHCDRCHLLKQLRDWTDNGTFREMAFDINLFGGRFTLTRRERRQAVRAFARLVARLNALDAPPADENP